MAEICQRLDGIPLAIELAAARSRCCRSSSCSPPGRPLRLLTGGSRMALPRHQTLRATMDWSYELLAEPEQSLPPAGGVCRRLDAGGRRGGLWRGWLPEAGCWIASRVWWTNRW